MKYKILLIRGFKDKLKFYYLKYKENEIQNFINQRI